ncbi:MULTISPECIES: hypothetical protein [Lachnospiraceae]|uniref:hypothetical protein n=1 Tax=Lachnospiraceae TaxID=186803 RepID=UPI00210CD6A6|nr:hypothetical protein [Blautia producta]
MKNEKITVMPKPKKRWITLTGYPAFPLRTGERVWIVCANNTFLTSTVQTILEASFDCLVFETQNTVYRLSNTAHVNQNEVKYA